VGNDLCAKSVRGIKNEGGGTSTALGAPYIKKVSPDPIGIMIGIQKTLKGFEEKKIGILTA